MFAWQKAKDVVMKGYLIDFRTHRRFIQPTLLIGIFLGRNSAIYAQLWSARLGIQSVHHSSGPSENDTRMTTAERGQRRGRVYHRTGGHKNKVCCITK